MEERIQFYDDSSPSKLHVYNYGRNEHHETLHQFIDNVEPTGLHHHHGPGEHDLIVHEHVYNGAHTHVLYDILDAGHPLNDVIYGPSTHDHTAFEPGTYHGGEPGDEYYTAGGHPLPM